jgi:hypothetical protein
MFMWYQNAVVCYAYLEDVTALEDINLSNMQLYLSRWFTRGWTLQELIAPRNVVFYSSEWQKLGDKLSLASHISQITRIDTSVLCGIRRPQDVSIARRMSWASGRNTTRVEDEAYCLLGIFGVNMPLLYGEGRRAFIRLQEEILKESSDYTLFLWSPGPIRREYSGAFAPSASAFYDSGDYIPLGDNKEQHSLTNQGLSIRLPVLEKRNLKYYDGMYYTHSAYIGILKCARVGARLSWMGIELLSLDLHAKKVFARSSRPPISIEFEEVGNVEVRDIYIIKRDQFEVYRTRPATYVSIRRAPWNTHPGLQFHSIYTADRQWSNVFENQLIELSSATEDTELGFLFIHRMAILCTYDGLFYAIVLDFGLHVELKKVFLTIYNLLPTTEHPAFIETRVQILIKQPDIIPPHCYGATRISGLGDFSVSATPHPLFGEELLVVDIDCDDTQRSSSGSAELDPPPYPEDSSLRLHSD